MVIMAVMENGSYIWLLMGGGSGGLVWWICRGVEAQELDEWSAHDLVVKCFFFWVVLGLYRNDWDTNLKMCSLLKQNKDICSKSGNSRYIYSVINVNQINCK